MICECWAQPNEPHAGFCPARTEPAEVKCVGTIHWEPDNRKCLACGRFGQSCGRTKR